MVDREKQEGEVDCPRSLKSSLCRSQITLETLFTMAWDWMKVPLTIVVLLGK